MTEKTERIDLDLLLKVADTIHDFGKGERCEENFSIDTIVDIILTKNNEAYKSQLNKFNKGDFENNVTKFIRTKESLINVKTSKTDLLNQLNQKSTNTFSIDYVPGQYSDLHTYSNKINTIATFWDPSITRGKKVTPLEENIIDVECIHAETVTFSNNYVKLNNDDKACSFPLELLKNRFMNKFSNSVSTICSFIKDLKSKEDITDLVQKHFFSLKNLTGKRKNGVEKTPNNLIDQALNDNVFEPFSQYLMGNVYDKDRIVRLLFDMKRSGDYGQISVLGSFFKMQNKPVLVTGDRLCYLMGQKNMKNVVLVKPSIDDVYQSYTETKNDEKLEQLLDEYSNKFSKLKKQIINKLEVWLTLFLNKDDYYDAPLNIIYEKLSNIQLDIERINERIETLQNEADVYNIYMLDILQDDIAFLEFCDIIKQNLKITVDAKSEVKVKFDIIDEYKSNTYVKMMINTIKTAFDYNNESIPINNVYLSTKYNWIRNNKQLYDVYKGNLEDVHYFKIHNRKRIKISYDEFNSINPDENTKIDIQLNTRKGGHKEIDNAFKNVCESLLSKKTLEQCYLVENKPVTKEGGNSIINPKTLKFTSAARTSSVLNRNIHHRYVHSGKNIPPSSMKNHKQHPELHNTREIPLHDSRIKVNEIFTYKGNEFDDDSYDEYYDDSYDEFDEIFRKLKILEDYESIKQTNNIINDILDAGKCYSDDILEEEEKEIQNFRLFYADLLFLKHFRNLNIPVDIDLMQIQKNVNAIKNSLDSTTGSGMDEKRLGGSIFINRNNENFISDLRRKRRIQFKTQDLLKWYKPSPQLRKCLIKKKKRANIY